MVPFLNSWEALGASSSAAGKAHATEAASRCFAQLFISLNFLNFHTIDMYILVKLLEM
jgi:hypothetical protein